MDKIYGSMSDEELNKWEKLPVIVNILTSKEFGAWLLRRDENRDKQNSSRPKGEWLHKKFDSSLKAYGQCSNCLQRERVGNFCRNCGAEMKIKEISPYSGIREFDKKFADLLVFNDQPQRQLKSCSDVHEDV